MKITSEFFLVSAKPNMFLIIITVFFVLNSANALLPQNFIFGVATSAYQNEGAWNLSGKGLNIWDFKTHNFPNQIKDKSNADVTTDSYHRFKEDIQLLVKLGVDSYRFSISWSRILPTGLSNKINPDGIRYYNDLINECLLYNITPFVTIYHWDLPNDLEFLGGWSNPILAEYFRDYAEVVFRYFGDRVKFWMTFNEPYSFCLIDRVWSPKFVGVESAVAFYWCTHTVLRAHAKVYWLYKTYFKGQGGQLGMGAVSNWRSPVSEKSEDVEAAERVTQFVLDLYAHPIFSKTGDYPPYLKSYITNISSSEGFTQSKLPEFTSDEIRSLIGSADFMAFNHYTLKIAGVGNYTMLDRPSFDKDLNVQYYPVPDKPHSEIGWADAPEGFYNILMYIKNKYNPKIFITENGYAESPIEDLSRIRYLTGYLGSLEKAIEDGVNVLGYYVWTLLDNFEWFEGFTQRFGLYYVNFSDPSLPRVPRKSAFWYKSFIQKQKSRV